MPKTTTTQKRASLGVAAAVALFAMAPAAQASTVELAYQGSNAWGTPAWARSVSYELNGNAKTHGAGLFRLEDTGTGQSVLAWCIDLLNTLALPATHSTTAVSATAAQLTNIDKLFTSAYNMVTDADTAAGFQIALWEIMSDTGSAEGLDLSNGEFETTGSGTHYTLAAGYLSGLEAQATGGYTLTTYFNATSQNLVEGTIAPPAAVVPVPAAGLLLLSGIAGFGMMRRRKKA